MNDTNPSGFQVIDEKGVRGTVDLTVAPPSDAVDARLVLIRFEDGSRIFADAASFVEREPGVFYFPGSFEQLFAENPAAAYGEAAADNVGKIVVPIIEEQLKITRARVLTGGVRVHKTIEERTETVSEPVLQEQVNVERVAVNKYIDAAPPVRYEGDVMIVPLVEEVLVVEKRLVLREEIRITKISEQVQKQEQIVLRSERATLERIQPEDDPTGNASVNRTTIRES